MQTVVYIPGAPVGKGRPRVAVQGGHAHAYTPQRTKDYEWLVQKCFAAQKCAVMPRGEALSVTVEAVCPVPESATKKQRAEMLEGRTLPTKKPDADNVLKIILDALNGVAYEDDRQIVALAIRKTYGEKPVVRVEIRTIAPEADDE